VVEQRFRKDAAAAVGRAHEQDSHGGLLCFVADVRGAGAVPGPKG
jgi:hypothetical protein